MVDLLNAGEVIGSHNLTKLFSQAPAPIAIYKGRQLLYVFANDAYLKIFNYREILGKTVREAFPELEGQPFYSILENVFDSGEPYFGNETPALVDANNDGVLQTRYYNLVYTPYRNDDGIIEGVMAFGHDVTDQVEARSKERAIDLRFRSIVEQSKDPILILKGEDLILEVANQALFDLWNVDSTAIGKGFLEILPEMKDQVFHELLLDVYHNGAIHHGNEVPGYFQQPGGIFKTHYFNFIYQPYREADQHISGVLVLATDVTEQVLAKQRLANSEINFRNMIEQAPVAMCVLKNTDFVVEIANELMYELWGKKKEDMLGKPIFEGLPEAKGQGFEDLLNSVYSTGTRFIDEERAVYLPRNGEIELVYINFVYEAYRDGDGNISGVIAVATDLTNQVVARQKIEYAEESARLAIESADLGTYEVNLLTDEMHTSPRFDVIWGIDQPTTNRSQFAAVLHPEDMPIRNQAHKDGLATGNLHYEARINRKDGSQRWIRVKGKVLRNNEGVPARLLGVIQDITEQKLFAGELSKKVEERTKALQEANERLERSNEELEQFAYVSSHDLQEPLRKIQIFSNLLLEHPDHENTQKYLEKVNSAAVRMTGLIRDLLDYSRLSKTSLHFQNTDLNDVLKNVLVDFELLINQKQATITTDALPVLPAVPLQMNQLLYNLIGNALKFSRTDIPPVITVRAVKLTPQQLKQYDQLSGEREYYAIKVTDNGIGFNEAYADKIFTIFQTLHEKSKYSGHGIGLALCRKIINTHNGILFAESNEQQGASFTFILSAAQ